METGSASTPPIGGTKTTIALGASPAIYQNTGTKTENVIISGGTVTVVEISRDGTTYDIVGVLAGAFLLAPLDRIRVTYTILPTVKSAYQL